MARADFYPSVRLDALVGVQALGLGRILSPAATPPEIRDAVTDMLSDKVLRAACQSFAARVNRFGDLMRAADLVVDCQSRSSSLLRR